MLSMRAFALIATLATATLSKSQFEFDNAKSAAQFDWSRHWAHASQLVQEDEGMMRSPPGRVRKLDNFGRGFTCKWKCRCDQPATPEPVSPEPSPVDFVPIKSLSELKEDLKLCIKNQATGKVMKLQADSRLDQTDSTSCADATLYVVKNYQKIRGNPYSIITTPKPENI